MRRSFRSLAIHPVQRPTILIDPRSWIAEIHRYIDPAKHPTQVPADLDALEVAS